MRTQEKLGTLEEAIKITDQFKIDESIALEETQIIPKAIEEAHIEQEALEGAHIKQEVPEKAHVPENYEILVSYVHMGKNGIQIILLLTIFMLFKWPMIS